MTAPMSGELALRYELSVVIPTRNRAVALQRTLASLCDQDLEPSLYEIVVVDDGSEVPPALDQPLRGPRTKIISLAHGERSRTRNAGAAHATGRVLLFLDDDMTADRSLLRAHLIGQNEWPGSLGVGATTLPDALVATPFGRFRSGLESGATPNRRGPVDDPNFCAANFSILRKRFLEIGGFEPQLRSAEDQDFALRHSAAGGTIVYLPEARAVHEDSNGDLRAYCRRSEWGAEHMAPFCARYPKWPDNRARFEINGPIQWRRDPPRRILTKAIKEILALPRATAILFRATDLLERRWPESGLLPFLYRLALGVHLQKGFRRGWHTLDRRAGAGPPDS